MTRLTLSLKNDAETLSGLSFQLGEKKKYKNDPLYGYHDVKCQGSHQMFNGLQLIVTEESEELSIVYSGNNTILLRLRENSKLLELLRGIQAKIEAAAPPGMSLAPLVKEAEQEGWAPSFKMKTDWTAVHTDSTGQLQQGHVLKRCLFTISRINHYQGRYYHGIILKSALISNIPCSHGNSNDTEEEDLAMLDEE